MRSSSNLSNFSEEQSEDINLTPMLDVVFIMLIFFIVTATFIRQPGISVEKSIAKTSNSMPAISMLVAVNDKNEIWIDKKRVSPQHLKIHLSKLYEENPKGSLLIQADKQSNFKFVKTIFKTAKTMGIQTIGMSVLEE